MSAPSTIAAALVSLLDTAPSWLPQVDHWEIAEDTDTWILSGQLAGDPGEAEAFRLLAPVIERAPSAHSDDGRLVKVPFEWDGVSGQVWYLRPVERYVVPERCASCPTLLADAGNQFVRLGGRGAPVICVPCRDRMHEAWVREAAVRELGALPMPVGPEPVSEAALDVAVDGLAAYLRVRLALESAQRGRRELRAEVAELKRCQRNQADNFEVQAALIRQAEARVAELEAAQGTVLRRTVSWRLEVMENDCWWDCGQSADSYPAAQDLLARERAEKPGIGFRLVCRTTTDALPAEQRAASSYPPALPWAKHMDDEDLSDFLDELAASAITHASAETALAEVEKTCGTWRLIAEAQHAHNTAPGPDAEAGDRS